MIPVIPTHLLGDNLTNLDSSWTFPISRKVWHTWLALTAGTSCPGHVILTPPAPCVPHFSALPPQSFAQMRETRLDPRAQKPQVSAAGIKVERSSGDVTFPSGMGRSWPMQSHHRKGKRHWGWLILGEKKDRRNRVCNPPSPFSPKNPSCKEGSKMAIALCRTCSI